MIRLGICFVPQPHNSLWIQRHGCGMVAISGLHICKILIVENCHKISEPYQASKPWLLFWFFECFHTTTMILLEWIFPWQHLSSCWCNPWSEDKHFIISSGNFVLEPSRNLVPCLCFVVLSYCHVVILDKIKLKQVRYNHNKLLLTIVVGIVRIFVVVVVTNIPFPP